VDEDSIVLLIYDTFVSIKTSANGHSVKYNSVEG